MRDLTEVNVETLDVSAYYKKISAASEMKTAIKNYLDECEGCIKRSCPKHRKLRRALAAYCRC